MFVSIGDVRLFVDILSSEYLVEGSRMVRRPTVVMLHGGPGMDSAVTRGTGALLTDVASVVVYDHRGNGRSDRGDVADWTLDRWADDVVALCDVLGIQRPIVAGGSFGGFVAMRYAARHPDHPAGLVLYSTSATMDDDASIEAFRRLGGDEVAAIVARDFAEMSAETSDLFMKHALPLMSRHPDAQAKTAEIVAQTVRRQDVELHFNNGEFRSRDQRGDLTHIVCPTLVVVGEDDPITPPALADEIAATIKPDLVRLVRLPNTGHLLPLDDPDGFGSAFRDFVSSIGAATDPHLETRP
jgi:pimeloyl-ACP methyl ester carboxylesterase